MLTTDTTISNHIAITTTTRYTNEEMARRHLERYEMIKTELPDLLKECEARRKAFEPPTPLDLQLDLLPLKMESSMRDHLMYSGFVVEEKLRKLTRAANGDSDCLRERQTLLVLRILLDLLAKNQTIPKSFDKMMKGLMKLIDKNR